VGETLDALAAVGVAGLERDVLREALAATLVKDEDDRAAFDRRFDETFPLRPRRPPAERGRGARGRPGGAGGGAAGAPGATPGGAGRGGSSRDGGASGAAEPHGESVAERWSVGSTSMGSGAAEDCAGAAEDGATRRRSANGGDERLNRADAEGTLARPGGGADDPFAAASRRGRARALRRKPFAEYTVDDLAAARALMAELSARLQGRLARRERERRRGRLDLRRTLRAAARSGGVPLRLRHRGRRRARPDLVALCDLSGSVAAVSELLLALIAPAARFFRHAQLFGYVDRLCPVSLEAGHVAPDGPLDLYARSDFGRVLGELWPAYEAQLGAGTLVVILGDARNNRLPPRPDLLRAVRERVQRVVWLNPEPRARWSTGDSVQHLYAPLCDAVLECADLDALVAAVRRLS